MRQDSCNRIGLQFHIITQAATSRYNHRIRLGTGNISCHRCHSSTAADSNYMLFAIAQQLAENMCCSTADFTFDNVLLVRITGKNDNLANLQRITESAFQKRNILQLAYIIRQLFKNIRSLISYTHAAGGKIQQAAFFEKINLSTQHSFAQSQSCSQSTSAYRRFVAHLTQNLVTLYEQICKLRYNFLLQINNTIHNQLHPLTCFVPRGTFRVPRIQYK